MALSNYSLWFSWIQPGDFQRGDCSLLLLLGNEWFFYSTWQPSCLVGPFHQEDFSEALVPAAKPLKVKVRGECRVSGSPRWQVGTWSCYKYFNYILVQYETGNGE